MAQAFARLGSQVTLDRSRRPTPAARGTRGLGGDRRPHWPAMASPCGSAPRRRSSSAARTAPSASTPNTGEPIAATHLLAAIGRAPSGRGFGLEEIGVVIDKRGAITVDDTMATNVDGIWAVGDVTGRLQFTHVAGRMGWIAATNALSKLARVRRFRLDTRADSVGDVHQPRGRSRRPHRGRGRRTTPRCPRRPSPAHSRRPRHRRRRDRRLRHPHRRAAAVHPTPRRRDGSSAQPSSPPLVAN